MNKDDAIKILRQHQADLRARGIVHAALFGSVARGEAGTKSDLDILIELDPGVNLDIFAVVNKDALKPYLRQPVSADAVYAF